MNLEAKYWLPTLWLLLLGVRILGARDPITLWTLRILTVAGLVALVVVVARSVGEMLQAVKRGEPVLTARPVRGALLGSFVLGLVLRIVGWDDGSEGVVAWAGGILILVSLAGLVLLSYLREREVTRNTSFYFNPDWKYGLVLVCVITISIQSLVQPEGAASSLNVWAFVVALFALIVQTVGKWFMTRRGASHSPADDTATGPKID
jgi:hypothetical protein